MMNHTELSFKEEPGTLQRKWVVSFPLYLKEGVQSPTAQALPFWMAPSIGTWLPSRLNGGKRVSRGKSFLMSIKKYVRENSSRGSHHFPISDSRATEGSYSSGIPLKRNGEALSVIL